MIERIVGEPKRRPAREQLDENLPRVANGSGERDRLAVWRRTPGPLPDRGGPSGDDTCVGARRERLPRRQQRCRAAHEQRSRERVPATIGPSRRLPAGTPAGGAAIASSSSRRASAMSCRRRLRILLQAAGEQAADGFGVEGGSASHAGSRSRTRASVSASESPRKQARPVSISNSTQPNAQMSVRRSTLRPLACSGDMYAAVPSDGARPRHARSRPWAS